MLDDDLRDRRADPDSHKRADYILERGMWKAVCRTCRFTVQHSDRQRASILFRSHQRDVLTAAPTAPVVDLRSEATLSAVGVQLGLTHEQTSA